MKLLYKPLSLLTSVLGGVLAGAVFKRVWKAVAGEAEPPEATSPDYGMRQIMVAAALQGAIFGGVKAAVDRAGVKGFQKLTGTHPRG